MTQFPKAYKETLEILKYVPKREYNKIPKYIIENMEKEQDLQYDYEVTEFKNFEQQKMLRETEAILLVLFRDYWATEEQKKWIVEKLEKTKIESEKSKNYKPLNDIFEKEKNGDKRKEIQENGAESNIQEKQLCEIRTNNIMQKIIEKLKIFFK